MGRPPQKIAAASHFSFSAFQFSAFSLPAPARYRAAPAFSFQLFSFSPYRPLTSALPPAINRAIFSPVRVTVETRILNVARKRYKQRKKFTNIPIAFSFAT
jgi:hypothetical protein